jgi:hypothetical protein
MALQEALAMDEYREKVERLACERTGEPFYNSTIDHAAVIIEKMFRHAKNEVYIVTKQLNGRVFGQDAVVREARGFLSNTDHKVRILMEDDASSLSEGHPLVEELRQHPMGYQIKQLKPEVARKLEFHFTGADKDSYRFEPDKEEWEAIAVFGDDTGGERLHSVFGSMWEMAKDIQLPEKTVSALPQSATIGYTLNSE